MRKLCWIGTNVIYYLISFQWILPPFLGSSLRRASTSSCGCRGCASWDPCSRTPPRCSAQQWIGIGGEGMSCIYMTSGMLWCGVSRWGQKAGVCEVVKYAAGSHSMFNMHYNLIHDSHGEEKRVNMSQGEVTGVLYMLVWPHHPLSLSPGWVIRLTLVLLSSPAWLMKSTRGCTLASFSFSISQVEASPLGCHSYWSRIVPILFIVSNSDEGKGEGRGDVQLGMKKWLMATKCGLS